VQTATPHELRGRVLSVYLTVFAGSAPFGALIAGAAANAFGTPASMALCGTITVVAAGLVALLWQAVPLGASRLIPVPLSLLRGRTSLPETSSRED